MNFFDTFQGSLIESGLLSHSCVECIVQYHDHDHDETDNTSFNRGSLTMLSSMEGIVGISLLRFHKDLHTRSRKRSIGVIPTVTQSWTLSSE